MMMTVFATLPRADHCHVQTCCKSNVRHDQCHTHSNGVVPIIGHQTFLPNQEPFAATCVRAFVGWSTHLDKKDHLLAILRPPQIIG